MSNDKINVNLEDWAITEGLVIAPYISDFNQRTLIGIYLQDLFADGEDIRFNYINAENSLLLASLEILTNIKLTEGEDENAKPLFNLNDVFANMDTVNEWLRSISNYADFKERLYETIEMVKEERRLSKSLGSTIDGLQERVMSLLQAFEDLDPEKLSEMMKTLESSPILRESIDIFKNQKSAKSE